MASTERSSRSPLGQPSWDRLSVVGARLVDLGLLAGITLIGFFDVLSASNDGFRAVIGIGSCVLALLMVAVRRRRPLEAMAVMILVVLANTATRGSYQWYPLVAPVAALGALAMPVVRRQSATTAALAASAGAVAVGTMLMPAGSLYEWLVLFTLLGGTYAIGVGAGIYLRDLDRQRRVAAESARHEERMDLARELHDLVAHYVTGIVVQAQAAQVVPGQDGDTARRALEQIEDAGKAALTAMRGLVGSLRDGGEQPTGPLAPPVGLAGLDGLAAACRSLGIPVDLRVDQLAAHQVSGAVAGSTHRIVQEALTNVQRHATGASRVTVDVTVIDDHLVTTVTDDGRLPIGGPLLDRRGYGLIGMAERAHTLAGSLAAGPVDPPGHGWRVEARLPLTTETESDTGTTIARVPT